MKTSEDEMEENHLNLDFVLSDSWKKFYKYILNLITIFFLWLHGSLPNKCPLNKPDEHVKKNKSDPFVFSEKKDLRVWGFFTYHSPSFQSPQNW